MIYFRRLDKVVALKTTDHITKGKIYTVLGVKKYHLLIATDRHQRVYLQSDFFMPTDIYFRKLDDGMEQRLEGRGF